MEIFYSHKKVEEFKAYFKDFEDLEYSSVIKHCATRWLSMTACITRLLDHYEPLKLYFMDNAEKRGKVKTIRQLLTSKSTKFYLMFLKAILKHVDGYNKKFQVGKLLYVQCLFLCQHHYDIIITLF